MHADIACTTAGGADLERVASGHRAALEIQGETVNDLGRGVRGSERPHIGAVGALDRVLGGAGERDLIVVGGQRAAVSDADIEVACANISGRRLAALADGRGTVDAVEQRRAELAIGIQALAQLLVDRIGDHNGCTAQIVHRRGQHIVAVTQQAADLAATDHRGHIRTRLLEVDLDAVLAFIDLARHRRNRVRGAALHQRLAGTQGNIVDVVVFLNRHPDQLVEAAHGFVTRIQQVVRRIARRGGLGDLLVQRSNGGRVLVDHRGEGVQLAVDALVLLVELGRNRVEAVAQGLRTGQQQLPRGHITGRRGGSLQ